MPESDFWALIDVMGGESDDTALERLAEALERSGKKPARAFQERLAAVLHDLDREVLAAQPVRFEDEEDDDEPIPLSDDSFLYLRAGIVTRGPDVVAAVVADPTVLAQGRWPECEELLYVAEEVVGDEIETKVSYESASNERHWSPRPDAGPPEGWTPPLVFVDGEDRDDPSEGGISHEDGTFEEIIDYLPPSYLPMNAFFSASDVIDDVVKRNGGLPAQFEGRQLWCAIEFSAARREPLVGNARHTFDGADVVRSSVAVTHATARAWHKPQRATMVEALAAHAALRALPQDHGARRELETIAGRIALD
jgi:hypothetical protein